MMKKTKTFDCVDMKNRIQRELREEYEARKAEFASYTEFINATANESEEIRAFREKVLKAKALAESLGSDSRKL